MKDNLEAILTLEVPIVVRLGQRALRVRDVLDWIPGSIVEIPKKADEALELLVNNREIGLGRAVKVGENFGIRITHIGSATERVSAMGPQVLAEEPSNGGGEELSAEELAMQMLAGQV